MFAKVIDEKTKQCEVGIGTDSDFYRSIGMTEQEVEQAWDGQWYIKGYAPSKPLEQLSAEKRAERNEAINSIIWRVQRYEQQRDLGIETADSEETYHKILEYIQYLRVLPQSQNFPNTDVKNFNEWIGDGEAF